MLKYYKACESIIKKHSKTYYQAFSKLKDIHKRYAIYAIYKFCRTVDDYIDEDQDIGLLNQMQSSLSHYIKTNEAKNDVIMALDDALKPFKVDFKPYFDQIEGQRYDFDFKPFATIDHLKDYCYLVAGSVGDMLLPILTHETNSDVKVFAKYLGEAFQITNILRDIGSDLKRNCIYISKDVMVRFNYFEVDFYHQINDDRFKKMFDYMADIAQKQYQNALELIHHFDEEAQSILKIALYLYREIIEVIINHGYDVFSKKHFVSLSRKRQIVLSVMKEGN